MIPNKNPIKWLLPTQNTGRFFAAEPCIKQLTDFLTYESKMKKEMIQTAVIGLIAILAFSAGAVDKPISASAKDKDLKWGPCPAFFPTKCDGEYKL